MLPASFAIPYLLTAPLPPSLGIEFVPVSDAACRLVAQACYATVEVEARNQSNRTLRLSMVSVAVMQPGGAAFEIQYGTPLEIPAFGAVSLDHRFELHVEAPHEIVLRYRVWGHRAATQRKRVLAARLPNLREAAEAACARCNGGHQETCACHTRDGGRRCTEPRQCEGLCLFDRVERLPGPACEARPGTICPLYPVTGYKVGHCSELAEPFGCYEVLAPADSASHPFPVPGPRSVRCTREAGAGRGPAIESSRRR